MARTGRSAMRLTDPERIVKQFSGNAQYLDRNFSQGSGQTCTDSGWELRRADAPARSAVGPDGESIRRCDTVALGGAARGPWAMGGTYTHLCADGPQSIACSPPSDAWSSPASAPGWIAGRPDCKVLALTRGFAASVQAVTSRRACHHAHFRYERKFSMWSSGSPRAPNLPHPTRCCHLGSAVGRKPRPHQRRTGCQSWVRLFFFQRCRGRGSTGTLEVFRNTPTGAAHAHSRPRPCR